MDALLLIVSAVILAGDQFFKYWITQNVELYGEYPVIPGFFHLTYLQNDGAAFSMLRGMRWPLVAVACACTIAILVYILKGKGSRWSKLGMAMILGGALGNLIDRIRFGYVVDMFEVEFTEYAVFNIADMCIVTGGVLFCFIFLFFPNAGKGEKTGKKQGQKKSAFPETGKLVNEEPGTKWTETNILESYDLERMLKEEDIPETGDKPEDKREN